MAGEAAAYAGSFQQIQPFERQRETMFTQALGGITAANAAALNAGLLTAAQQFGETMRAREVLDFQRDKLDAELKADRRQNALSLAKAFSGSFGGFGGGGGSNVALMPVPEMDPYKLAQMGYDLRARGRADLRESTERSRGVGAQIVKGLGSI